MKQSTFKQSFLTKGTVKTVSAEIVVTMSYTTKDINGTNAGSHDDFSQTIFVHKIEAFVDGKLWKRKLELQNEFAVEVESQKMMKQLVAHIENIANSQAQRTFVEKMEELGFK